jgi:tetratricopeptide (TPR) repeat protein
VLRPVALLLLFATLFAVAAPAEAQRRRRQRPRSQVEQARDLFEEGRRAFDAGNYEAALGSFRASYDLVGTPEILFNIGTCADYLHRDEEALAAFESYLAELPEAPDRVAVQARIRAIRAAIDARNAPPEPVPTPAEAAASTEGSSPGPLQDEPPALTSRWWFWTGVGAIAVGAILAVTLIATSGTTVQSPTPGDDGVIVYTLLAP